MKVLFDHNVNRRFRGHLPGHEVVTAREMGWETLGNGVLLQHAADAGFKAMVTLDKKLEHEQNLNLLPLPVIVIDATSNALPALVPFAGLLLELLSAPLATALYVVQVHGTILRLTAPRP